MVQFASYLRRILCKTRLIFPRINGPNVLCSRPPQNVKLGSYTVTAKNCEKKNRYARAKLLFC